MKRVAMDPHQSHSVLDEQARARLKHQSLLHDFLELQKDFVSKKKKLQMAEQKKETLLAEVRFLRQRHRYLLEMQSPKQKLEEDLVQQQNSDRKSKMHMEEINYKPNDATLRNLSILLETNPISGGVEEKEGKKEHCVREPLRVQKKPNNCLINEKRVGKKKISWQDPVPLKMKRENGEFLKLGLRC